MKTEKKGADKNAQSPPAYKLENEGNKTCYPPSGAEISPSQACRHQVRHHAAPSRIGDRPQHNAYRHKPYQPPYRRDIEKIGHQQDRYKHYRVQKDYG